MLVRTLLLSIGQRFDEALEIVREILCDVSSNVVLEIVLTVKCSCAAIDYTSENAFPVSVMAISLI